MSKTIIVKLTRAGANAGPFTITDDFGNDYVYRIYTTGIQIIYADLNVYADFLNQTYITDLLETIDE